MVLNLNSSADIAGYKWCHSFKLSNHICIQHLLSHVFVFVFMNVFVFVFVFVFMNVSDTHVFIFVFMNVYDTHVNCVACAQCAG